MENETPKYEETEIKPFPTAAVGETELVTITKRQIKNIARRSGKTIEEIRGLHYYGRMRIEGGKAKIKYVVVAE